MVNYFFGGGVVRARLGSLRGVVLNGFASTMTLWRRSSSLRVGAQARDGYEQHRGECGRSPAGFLSNGFQCEFSMA